MGPEPIYQVVELLDPSGLPRYVAARRVGESFGELAFAARRVISSPLMTWLAGLELPPAERPLLGRATVGHWTALLLIRHRLDEIARMAGCIGRPDFVLNVKPVHGRTHFRPVAAVRGDEVQRFPSLRHAAEAIGTTRRDLQRRVELGCPGLGGWVWFDNPTEGVVVKKASNEH